VKYTYTGKELDAGTGLMYYGARYYDPALGRFIAPDPLPPCRGLSPHRGDGGVADLRYKAWGETRHTYGTTPTTFRFTGQREDATIGLYFYNARYYDPVLGRFIAPDTIVPEPGNPQALNRYSYVLNNALRYTDPTGMFSEDEIMKYLGVDSWNAVLALFEDGGRLAGQWGLLGVLREADIGSRFTMMQEICNGQLCTEELYTGIFEDHESKLVLIGTGRFKGNNIEIAKLTSAGMTSAPPGRYYYVDDWRVGAGQTVYTLKFDPARVDWINVSLGVAGLGQDAGIAIAIAGAATVDPILLTVGISMVGLGTAAEATEAARTYAQYKQGNATLLDVAVSWTTSLAGGLAPGPAGIGISLVGIGYDLFAGLYLSL